MVHKKSYSGLPIDKSMIYRFCGYGSSSDENIEALISECISEISDKLSYRLCYTVLPVSIEGDTVILPSFKVDSVSLAGELRHCRSVILFACTLGLEIDRYIERYSSLSPVKALIYSSVGSAQVEVLCDRFCHDMETEYNSEGIFMRPRFSAGYGDLPIEVQKNIFSLLDCQRKIGLTLNESMMMSPSKSVSAFIGLYRSN